MSRSTDTHSHRALTLARVGFAVTVGAAIGLGYWGLFQYAASPRAPEMGSSPWDLLYYDLQLFVLGTPPLEQGGWFPWQLQLARFLAPAATAYAIFEAARAVFTDEWRSWRVRRTIGHTIVTGTTPLARAITNELTAGRQLVVATPSGDAASLHNAGIRGASVVYACADDSADSGANVLTVVAAANAPRRRRARTLAVYGHVSDPVFALALRARRLGLPRADQVHVDFFNTDELAARELVRRDGPAAMPASSRHIIVAGLGNFGQALVVEYAREWLYSPHAAENLLVTLVGPEAVAVAAGLNERWQILFENCQLRPVPHELAAAPAALDPPPHRVYLCHDDEHLAIREALTSVRLWGGGVGSVVVRLDRLARLGDAFSGPEPPLLDDLGGRLRIVAVSALAYHSRLIQEDLIERLARAVHRSYLRDQLRAGVPMGSAAGMVAWSHLPEDLRRSNREQAADIGAKLSAIGYTVGPFTAVTGDLAHDEELIERIAIAEHDRWMAERASQGWTFGPVRDDQTRQHPSMVLWSDLPEPERDKDRAAVRNIPTVLADVGLQMLPVGTPCVPEPRRVASTD